MKKTITKSVVIGGGSWGTTIALGLNNNNKNTTIITSTLKKNRNEIATKIYFFKSRKI